LCEFCARRACWKTMTDPMLVMYEEEIKASLEIFNQPKGKVEVWKGAEPGS